MLNFVLGGSLLDFEKKSWKMVSRPYPTVGVILFTISWRPTPAGISWKCHNFHIYCPILEFLGCNIGFSDVPVIIVHSNYKNKCKRTIYSTKTARKKVFLAFQKCLITFYIYTQYLYHLGKIPMNIKMLRFFLEIIASLFFFALKYYLGIMICGFFVELLQREPWRGSHSSKPMVQVPAGPWP